MVSPTRLSPSIDTLSIPGFQRMISWDLFLSFLTRIQISEIADLWDSHYGSFKDQELVLDALKNRLSDDLFLCHLDPEIIWALPDRLTRLITVLTTEEKISFRSGLHYTELLVRRLFVFALDHLSNPGRFILVLTDFFLDHDYAVRLRPVFLNEIILSDRKFVEIKRRLDQLVRDPSFPEELLPAALGVFAVEQNLESWEKCLKDLMSVREGCSWVKLFSDPSSAFYLSQTPILRSVRTGDSGLIDQHLSCIVKALKSLSKDVPLGFFNDKTPLHLIGMQIISASSRHEGLKELQDWIEILKIEEKEIPFWIAQIWKSVVPIEKQIEVFIYFAQVEGFPSGWKDAYFDLVSLEGAQLHELFNQWNIVQEALKPPASSSHARQFVRKALQVWEPNGEMTDDHYHQLVAFWKTKVKENVSFWAPFAKECLIVYSMAIGRQMEDFTDEVLELKAQGRLAAFFIKLKRPFQEAEAEWLASYRVPSLTYDEWVALLRVLHPELKVISEERLESFSRRALALWMNKESPTVLKQNVWLLMASSPLERNNSAGWKFMLEKDFDRSCLRLMKQEALARFLDALVQSNCPVPLIFRLMMQMNEEEGLDPSMFSTRTERLSLFSWLPLLQLLKTSPNPLILTISPSLLRNFINTVLFIPKDSWDREQLLTGLLDGRISMQLEGFHDLIVHLFEREAPLVFSRFHHKIMEEVREVLLKKDSLVSDHLFHLFTSEGKLFYQAVADKYLAALLTGKPS